MPAQETCPNCGTPICAGCADAICPLCGYDPADELVIYFDADPELDAALNPDNPLDKSTCSIDDLVDLD